MEYDRSRPSGTCDAGETMLPLSWSYSRVEMRAQSPELASAPEYRRHSTNAVQGTGGHRCNHQNSFVQCICVRSTALTSTWASRQLAADLASTSAQADAKSRFGASAAGIVAQPAFMTKSRCSYDDLMALNALSLATVSGSICD